MSWSLKGRSATAALDPPTRRRVLNSHMMIRCAHKPLLWVLEELTVVPAVAGLSGPLHRVEYFLCLVVRLLQICPKPSIVVAMLVQGVHKYMRVAALFMIRLIGDPTLQRQAAAIGWQDYRKVRIYGDELEYAPLSEEIGASMAHALPQRKRGREEASTTTSTSTATTTAAAAEMAELERQMDAEAMRKPSGYFLLRIDQVTDKLFGTETPLTTSANDDGRAPGQASGIAFGMLLPPLIL